MNQTLTIDNLLLISGVGSVVLGHLMKPKEYATCTLWTVAVVKERNKKQTHNLHQVMEASLYPKFYVDIALIKS